MQYEFGRFSAILYKGDNFYGFLFAFLCTKLLIKGVYSKKERICSSWEQILSFQSRPLPRGADPSLSQ